MKTHYHVVEFINGCLNDYDSGPFEDHYDALSHLQEMLARSEPGEYVATAYDRYERGIHILKVEECTNEDCALDDY